jgi:hypothetical protein
MRFWALHMGVVGQSDVNCELGLSLLRQWRGWMPSWEVQS